MKKILILILSVSTMIFLHADRQSTDEISIRLKSDATTDSIEHVIKEMLIAISTNDIEKLDIMFWRRAAYLEFEKME